MKRTFSIVILMVSLNTGLAAEEKCTPAAQEEIYHLAVKQLAAMTHISLQNLKMLNKASKANQTLADFKKDFLKFSADHRDKEIKPLMEKMENISKKYPGCNPDDFIGKIVLSKNK